MGEIACSVCNRRLGIRERRPGEMSARWACVGCGCEYVAVLDKDVSSEVRQTVRLVSEQLNPRDENVPPGIDTFVREWAPQLVTHDERRRSPRNVFICHVMAISLDADFVPNGEVAEIVTCNISQHGLGMVHTRAIRGEYLIVEIPSADGRRVQMLSRIVRCRSLGHFYDIGCEFIGRLGATTPKADDDASDADAPEDDASLSSQAR